MIQPVNLFRVKEQPRFLIQSERIVIPAVPETLHNPGELARALVTIRVFVVLIAAEIVRLVLETRGDDIPAGAAVAHVIERSKLARDVEGLVVTGRRRRNQADTLRHHCERAEHG